MPITENDIKIMASERLADTEDGGGRITGTIVQDGVENNLFDDVSQLDRTYGRVSLRKCFPAVLTNNTDRYFGAHVILDDGPDDPLVSSTIFSTENWVDTRAGARDRIESYLAFGPRYAGTQLLERQLAGQRAFSFLAREGIPMPNVGETYVLVAAEGLPTQVFQYVRVTDVNIAGPQDFTTAIGGSIYTFRRLIVTCGISDALRHEFDGGAPSPVDDFSAPARLRRTTVADAATYYGIRPLALAAASGAYAVRVAGIFEQLVPSAQSERATVDAQPSPLRRPIIDAAQAPTTFNTAAPIGAGTALFLGNPCLPGTLSITGAGTTVTDQAGALVIAGTVVGEINYADGALAFFSNAPTIGGTKAVSFRPAGAPIAIVDTGAIEVTQATRAYNYVRTLVPPPKPGALVVSYQVAGRWYDLIDDGSGGLRGADPAYGAGAVSYVTGTVAVTLGALPDIDSDVLLVWATGAVYTNRSGTAVDPASIIATALPHQGIAPGTLTVDWEYPPGTARAAAANTAGVISGSGGTSGVSGFLRHNSGDVEFTWSTLPNPGTEFTFSYQTGAPQVHEQPLPAPVGGTHSFSIATNVVPHSVFVRAAASKSYDSPTPAGIPRTVIEMRDNGAGGLAGGFGAATVNYTTGEISFGQEATVSERRPVYGVFDAGGMKAPIFIYSASGAAGAGTPYTPTEVGSTYVFSGYTVKVTGTELAPVTLYAAHPDGVRVEYRTADTTDAQEETLSPSIRVRLTPAIGERIIPGSVRFALGGRVYFDRLGQLFTDLNPENGAAIQAGTIDYAAGVCNLTLWTPGQSTAVTLIACLTEFQQRPVDELAFRTPIAPVKPGSLQILCNRADDGTLLNVIAQPTGEIVGESINGRVNYETGVVRIKFGTLINAAGAEGEPWYRADRVAEGKIFRPEPVHADTLRFNAVSYTYLPLDADVLGLDPVRLPQDGRVPIYRAGDVAVIHHTQRDALPGGSLDGYVFSAGRSRLAKVRLVDALGAVVPADRYAADLDAGTVTLDDPFDAGGLTLPIYVEHRIEDMALISSVDIGGELALTKALTHDFPAGATNPARVSGAIIVGDLFARSLTGFSQQTWTSVWQDTRIGAPIVPQYQQTTYPIGVSNRGCVQERWAIIFTGTTSFRVVGESLGEIATGSTGTLLAPMNPDAGQPYFTIQPGGWGGGWAAGNVFRFNTRAANFPVWVVRTVRQGEASGQSDSLQLQVRGDIDQ